MTCAKRWTGRCRLARSVWLKRAGEKAAPSYEKSNRTSPSLRFGVSSAGVPFGDPPLAPKAIELWLRRTVQSRCFRLARQAPSLPREQPGEAEGSASEAADVETKRFG